MNRQRPRGWPQCRRASLLLLVTALVATGACALINAQFSKVFTDSLDICAEVEQLHVKAAQCDMPAIAAFDQQECEDEYLCFQYFRGRCGQQWEALLSCLEQEHSCSELNAAPTWLPFCQAEYDAVEECIGQDDLAADCVGMVGSCTDGFCDVLSGEYPGDCADCPTRCEEGHYAQYCVPFKFASHCSTDLLHENDTSEDCGCNYDRICDLGESTYNCPEDCYCDFDGECGPGENPLGCPDCPACDLEFCGLLGEQCGSDAECAYPFVCYDVPGSGLQCMLPCDPSITPPRCPLNEICNSSTQLCELQ